MLAQPDPSHFSARIGGDVFGVLARGRRRRRRPRRSQPADRQRPVGPARLRLLRGHARLHRQRDDRPEGRQRAAPVRRPRRLALAAEQRRLGRGVGDLPAATTRTIRTTSRSTPTTQQPIAGQLTEHQHARRAVHPDPAALRPDAELEPALGPADLGLQLPEVRQHDAGGSDRLHRPLPRRVRSPGARRPRHRPVGPATRSSGSASSRRRCGWLRRAARSSSGWRASSTPTKTRPTTRQINGYDSSGALLPGFNPLELVDPAEHLPGVRLLRRPHLPLHRPVRPDRRPALRAQRPDVRRSEGGALLTGRSGHAVLTVPGRSSEGVVTFRSRRELHFDKNIMAYAADRQRLPARRPERRASGRDRHARRSSIRPA